MHISLYGSLEGKECLYVVKRHRALPQVGDIVEIRPGHNPYSPWVRVKITSSKFYGTFFYLFRTDEEVVHTTMKQYLEYVKVGTVPSPKLEVALKRTPPKVGEIIRVRECKPGYKWFTVMVDRYDEVSQHWFVSKI